MSYPRDEFGELDVLACLDRAGLKHKNGARYITTQCPTHEDKNPSTQIFKDDWFVNCLAGCGRYHITKAFPELRPGREPLTRTNRKMQSRKYETYDLFDFWKKLPTIPGTHVFKGVSLETLFYLGWRWDEAKNSYFIPYFSRDKQSVPFAQWRHLSGERRFTFLKDAQPRCYGTWNLHEGEAIFVVEGCSDAAVLEYCAVPWIALPSAASTALLTELAEWCKEHMVRVIYAGDRDEAGDHLRAALDGVIDYRVCQPPEPYKDWGDFFEAEGGDAVTTHCFRELFGNTSSLHLDESVDGGKGATQPLVETAQSLYQQNA